MSPLVTVLIPAYNAEATIRRAINSVLAQDYPAFEIVVIDDGSSDATTEIVAGYNHTEIRLLRLPRNRGECGALNAGIAIANGDYIAFLDHDDEWLPGKLARQIPLLEGNPKAIMATCGCRVVDGCGKTIREFGTKPPLVGKDQIWRFALAFAWIAKQSVVVRASAFQIVGLFDTNLPIGDQDMLIRLAMSGEVEFIDDYLTIQHDTPGSLSKRYSRDIDSILSIVKHYIEAQKLQLSAEDVRRILGERYTSIGRTLYLNGRLLRGAVLLVRAIASGAHRWQNLWYLVTASPPARFTKRLLHIGADAEAPTRQSLPRPTPGAALLSPMEKDLVKVPVGPPILIVGIDTEAEFDWSSPRLRTHHSVQNVREQVSVQDMFDKFGVRPVYLVDYAVATQAEGYAPLRELVSSGRCEIGAHLQAWENPPFEEELGERTSFNHHLPGWLQKEKLSRLTEAIVSNIGVQPVSYRGGRYGVGEEIAWILQLLGYQIDLSVLPGIDLRRGHGPDFRWVFNRPYWFGRNRDLLEIPITAGFTGLLSKSVLPKVLTAELYDLLSRPSLSKAHLPGIFARLGLLERITLTPEGITIDELKRLTLPSISLSGYARVAGARGLIGGV